MQPSLSTWMRELLSICLLLQAALALGTSRYDGGFDGSEESLAPRSFSRKKSQAPIKRAPKGPFRVKASPQVKPRGLVDQKRSEDGKSTARSIPQQPSGAGHDRGPERPAGSKDYYAHDSGPSYDREEGDKESVPLVSHSGFSEQVPGPEPPGEAMTYEDDQQPVAASEAYEAPPKNQFNNMDPLDRNEPPQRFPSTLRMGRFDRPAEPNPPTPSRSYSLRAPTFGAGMASAPQQATMGGSARVPVSSIQDFGRGARPPAPNAAAGQVFATDQSAPAAYSRPPRLPTSGDSMVFEQSRTLTAPAGHFSSQPSVHDNYQDSGSNGMGGLRGASALSGFSDPNRFGGLSGGGGQGGIGSHSGSSSFTVSGSSAGTGGYTTNGTGLPGGLGGYGAGGMGGYNQGGIISAFAGGAQGYTQGGVMGMLRAGAQGYGLENYDVALQGIQNAYQNFAWGQTQESTTPNDLPDQDTSSNPSFIEPAHNTDESPLDTTPMQVGEDDQAALASSQTLSRAVNQFYAVESSEGSTAAAEFWSSAGTYSAVAVILSLCVFAIWRNWGNIQKWLSRGFSTVGRWIIGARNVARRTLGALMEIFRLTELRNCLFGRSSLPSDWGNYITTWRQRPLDVKTFVNYITDAIKTDRILALIGLIDAAHMILAPSALITHDKGQQGMLPEIAKQIVMPMAAPHVPMIAFETLIKRHHLSNNSDVMSDIYSMAPQTPQFQTMFLFLFVRNGWREAEMTFDKAEVSEPYRELITRLVKGHHAAQGDDQWSLGILEQIPALPTRDEQIMMDTFISEAHCLVESKAGEGACPVARKVFRRVFNSDPASMRKLPGRLGLFVNKFYATEEGMGKNKEVLDSLRSDPVVFLGALLRFQKAVGVGLAEGYIRNQFDCGRKKGCQIIRDLFLHFVGSDKLESPCRPLKNDSKPGIKILELPTTIFELYRKAMPKKKNKYSKAVFGFFVQHVPDDITKWESYDATLDVTVSDFLSSYCRERGEHPRYRISPIDA